MLSLANVGIIVMSFAGTMFCHFMAPHIHRRIWRNYGNLCGVDKCKFDLHFGSTITGMLCFAFALKAFISDPDFHQLGLVGSSAAGNVALDITIGQCIADFLYHKMAANTYGSIRHVGHHIAVISGAVLTHNYFHRLFLSRCIHLVTAPFLMAYDQMNKLNYGARSSLFMFVIHVNWWVFFLFRIAVIPLFWLYCLYMMLSSWNELSEIWLLAVALLIIACGIAIDCANWKWRAALTKRYNEIINDVDRGE